MSLWLLVALLTAGFAFPVVAGMGFVWLAKSWTVAEDDDLEGWLAGRGGQPAGLLRFLSPRWFARRTLQLTYRRDKLGRFRHVNRW